MICVTEGAHGPEEQQLLHPWWVRTEDEKQTKGRAARAGTPPRKDTARQQARQQAASEEREKDRAGT